MNVIDLEKINRRAQIEPLEFINDSERYYQEKCIDQAAKYIRDNFKMHPTVLIAGPSGSGKTTSALRIEKSLESFGINSHTISMDNYFNSRDIVKPPVDEHGEVDLESPLCLDSELLKKHIEIVSTGGEIDIPIFDFATQRRKEERIPLKIGKDEVVVFEGIHALNPAVVGSISEYSIGVYISMRTRVRMRDGELIDPSLLRLFRRIVRDYIHRGRTPMETLNAKDSVMRGEQSYIMPFKKNADVSVDTFINYEGCVLGHMVKDLIVADKTINMYDPRLTKILQVMNEFVPIQLSDVPETSLLNEFII